MRTQSIFALAVIAVMTLAAPARAGVIDHLQIKVGVSAVIPDESASISVIGGNADVSDEYVPSLQLEYFFNSHVSAELLCCIARHDVAAVNTALGRVDLGKVTHFPPTVTLKYRWTNFGRVEPYVGAGVNYTHFFNEKIAPGGPVTDISYSDSVGPALQAGADFRLNDHWAINVDVRKIWINTDVRIQAGPTRIDANVDIDPWVGTVGVGYRF